LDGLLPAFDENTKPSAISFCADVICAMAAFGRRHEASVIAALDGRESAGIGRHEARPSTPGSNCCAAQRGGPLRSTVLVDDRKVSFVEGGFAAAAFLPDRPLEPSASCRRTVEIRYKSLISLWI
jgi:hypothetical protein